MISQQFFIFLVVGVLSALIDLTAMQSLIFFGCHYLLSTSVGFLLGLIVNYMLHANLTFKAPSSNLTIFKFGCVVVINYIITMIFVYAALHIFKSALLGKIASLPFIAINGFLLSKYWIFK